MPISENEKKRRYILCKCMVDIWRPFETDLGLTANERLVLYTVGISTFGPQRLGLDKIAGATGMPRSTVRYTLVALCKRGIVRKGQDRSYAVTEEFQMEAGEGMDVHAKYRQLVGAAVKLQSLGAALASNSDPNTVDTTGPRP
ncbi:MAG: hypothetical protein JWM36_823 [Hyphomicrobiales bacterium]|nr:hypothetical protein [Hyphomicrobiales bacterium]